jgi:hypothetical protein
MKTQSKSAKFPVEVSKVPGFTLQITVSARSEMLDALNAVGVGPEKLGNHIEMLLQEAISACDGVVPGLIVSNLESV